MHLASFLLYRKVLKKSDMMYNKQEMKNDMTKERRGLRHDVVYEVFCFGSMVAALSDGGEIKLCKRNYPYPMTFRYRSNSAVFL